MGCPISYWHYWLLNGRTITVQTEAHVKGVFRRSELKTEPSRGSARPVRVTRLTDSLGGFGSLSARQARITRSSRFNVTRGAAEQLVEFLLLRGNPVCGDFALGFHKLSRSSLARNRVKTLCLGTTPGGICWQTTEFPLYCQ